MVVDAGMLVIAFTFVAAAAVVFVAAALASRSWRTSADDSSQASSSQPSPAKRPPAQPKPKKSGWKDEGNRGRREDDFSHAWLATSLRHGGGSVTNADFAPSGKWLLSAADDRSLLLWTVKDFQGKGHNSIRGAVELDHASLVRFAPDSKSLICALGYANSLGVYKLEKKESAAGIRIVKVEGVDFPKVHIQDIHSLGMACNGRFILTASTDPELVLWDLKGGILCRLPTHQSILHQASITPCGRFVAASGFTPDVRVWEARFSRSGEFQELRKAFELKGHTSGVFAFHFNQDSTRAVSASKDGTLRFWDTDVRWEHGQDPRLLHTVEVPELKSLAPEAVKIELSGNGESFCLVMGRRLLLHRWLNEEAEGEIAAPHGSNPITCIRFSPDNRYLVSGGGRCLRVFHNVAEHRCLIASAPGLAQASASEAHRRRILQMAEESETFLHSLGVESA